jgi:hypothetical protein
METYSPGAKTPTNDIELVGLLQLAVQVTEKVKQAFDPTSLVVATLPP